MAKKKDERRRLTRALGSVPETLRIAEVREALDGLDLGTPHFLLQQAISGPFTLTALLVNGKNAIQDPIPSSGRSIAVPIGVGRPFDIRWSATFGQNQPRAVGYFVDGSTPLKIEEKRAIVGGSRWTSKPHRIS